MFYSRCKEWFKCPLFLHQQSSQPPEFSYKATRPHMPAYQAETNEAQTSCPADSGPHPLPASVVSGSSVSQPQAIAHVPAHMHFLCDVLPCPVQSSHASRQPIISQIIDESHTRVVCKKTQAPRDSVGTFTDEPVCEHVPSAPPASFGAVEREGPSQHKTSERKAQKRESERKTASSSRKQNKSRWGIETCTQCAKFKSECLMYIVLADIPLIGNMVMSPGLQTRVLCITKFPKSLCQGQSSSSQTGARGSQRDLLTIMHHQLLQSTAP